MADLVKMRHMDTGHQVDVHPDMVGDYAAVGYRAERPAPRRRGRPPKQQDGEE